MSAPEVSVVVVSYGTRDLTLAALESVRRASARTSLEAVVVDNASPDDSADAVASAHPWATLIRSSRNGGFGSGANVGAWAARGEWLLFLNSDARLKEESIPRLLAATRAVEAAGAVGPRILGPRGPERSAGHFYGPWRDFVQALRLYRLFPFWRVFEGVFLSRLPEDRRQVDWVSGACLLIRRELFLQVGGFDEAYFLYVEDMDLCWRLARTGAVNIYAPEAVVHHALGRSPRSGRVLIEGGGGPEYFIRKTGRRYPWILQRTLRILNIAIWLAGLDLRRWLRSPTGVEAEEAAAQALRCRATLAVLLRQRRVGLSQPPESPSSPPET